MDPHGVWVSDKGRGLGLNLNLPAVVVCESHSLLGFSATYEFSGLTNQERVL